MMSEQSALAAEGADEYTKYLELIWANLGCGLTSVTGFCTAINPIDFTLWTIEIFLAGVNIIKLLSSSLKAAAILMLRERDRLRSQLFLLFGWVACHCSQLAPG